MIERVNRYTLLTNIFYFYGIKLEPFILVCIAYNSLGCWKDSASKRVFKSLEGKSSFLDGHYKSRTNAIEKCFQAALANDWEIFALQDGGQCFGSSNPSRNYKKHGKANTGCSSGKGGALLNQVYLISKFILYVLRTSLEIKNV